MRCIIIIVIAVCALEETLKKIMITLRFTCFPGVDDDDVRSVYITEIYDISFEKGVHVHCSCCFLFTASHRATNFNFF